MRGDARVVVIGDSLLDRDIDGDVRRICPDSPAPVLDETAVRSRPGGAALAALLAAGRSDPRVLVTLVTAVASDGPGRELLGLLDRAGIEVVLLPTASPTAEKIRLRSGGQTLLRLDRGGARTALDDPEPTALAGAFAGAGAVLVADYGRGVTASPAVRSTLGRWGGPVVWDPHPRGSAPIPGCRVLTPNAAELMGRFGPGSVPVGHDTDVRTGGPTGTPPLASLTAAARSALAEWEADSVAVTCGDRGALLVGGSATPLVVPVPARHAGDTCGAGDSFAVGVAARLAAGALLSEAVTGAVGDAAGFVAAGAASALAATDGAATGPGPDSRGAGRPAGTAGPGAITATGDAAAAADAVTAVREAGGTVVAAGGCFDLLHAGHVALLQSARALGDCLVVCLNSDRSVRRLKGPGRPVNPQADRAATLAALGCVDAVAVFDEDTPEAVIRRLRPDVWVKGGDYDASRLPEASVLEEWGGQAVVLPYLDGRSTTGMIERAATGGR